jgi:hypothetical protein
MTDVYVAQGMSRTQAAQFAEIAANSMFTADVGEMSPEQRRQFEEQERRVAEFEQQQQQRQAEAARQQQQQPSQTTSNPSQLATPTGRAWVIQDNQTQGSGKAIVFKSDGRVETYIRRLGVWSLSDNSTYGKLTYTATGTAINVKTVSTYTYDENYNYTITGNGSTLTVRLPSANASDTGSIAGAYTFRDAPRIQPPGGNIVNPPGTAWDTERVSAPDIYHSDGIRYCFGGAGYASWYFGPDGNWYTYTANSSTGKLIRIYKGRENMRPEELNYSVTDFGGGNMTLRIWRVDNNFPHDTVWKLVLTPSGFQLPRVR